MTGHGQQMTDDTIPAHRWMRYVDPDTDEANHWCIDGDTEHHPEPCGDAANRTGDHENDPDEVTYMEVPQL